MENSTLFERIYTMTCDPWTLTDEEKAQEERTFWESIRKGNIQEYIDSIELARDMTCTPYYTIYGVYDLEEMKKYDSLIEELKNARPVSHFEKDSQGYFYFRKWNGIRYDLSEGKTIGGSQTYTSDIIYIMLESYDNALCTFVGWMWGANQFDSFNDQDKEYLVREFDQITDDFERENPDLIGEILSGEVEEL